MFSPPRGADEAGGAAVGGASDANPIRLSGVTELEFETLVRYFYKRWVKPPLCVLPLSPIEHG